MGLSSKVKSTFRIKKIIQNHHKAIVNRDAFDKVQAILNNTSNRVNRNGKYDILSGYVKCVDCGKIMIVKKGKNKEYYYCSSYIKDKQCSKHSISKKLLEELVLEKLKEDKNIDKLNRKVIYEYIKCVYILEDNKIKIEYKK